MATPWRHCDIGRLIVIFTCLVASCVSLQLEAIERVCNPYGKSCSQCIRSPGCQWCSDFDQHQNQNNSKSQNRCYSNEEPDTQCKPKYLANPQNDQIIMVNEPLTDVSALRNSDTNIIQIAPQKMLLKLRNNEPIDIKFRFRLATDYPVDLYYMMDLSQSMFDDKESLANLGNTIATTMDRLTTQFSLGFGSFVDKVVMPYVNIIPNKIKHPCEGCTSPYSFKNHLPLDPDATKFRKYVNNATISGNVDAPEGGLDALLQAIVCKEEIGWRDQARRLLILSTDAKFHHAGDGRLAGIVMPHDGLCHLTADGDYTHGHLLDYPSIAQINEAAQKHQVNIIFAVSKYGTLYQNLSAEIHHSSYGMLDAKSSNVVKLVEDQYKALSSEVMLTDNVGSIPGAPLAVRYYARCPNATGDFKETNVCHEVQEGEEIEFVARVEVVTVPDAPPGHRYQLNITTFQDTLTLDVEILGKCDCEKSDAEDREEHSPDCHSSGTRQCGVCACDEGHYGNTCKCDQETGEKEASAEETANCIADPNQSQLPCSGKGICECGTCNCNSQSVSGNFCECNDDQCRTVRAAGAVSAAAGAVSAAAGGLNPDVCSGRGTCDCGKCRCRPGWIGLTCDCPDNSSCMASGSTDLCSSKGNCSCGVCSCNLIGDVQYTGPYCQECPTCSTGKCREFRDCVQCRTHRSGNLAGSGCSICTIRPTLLTSLENELENGAHLCTFPDDRSGCDFNFTYEYSTINQKYFIFAQRHQQCPEELDVLAVVLGVIGGVVAVGLLTLALWKVLTTIHDRREFANFESEAANVKFANTESPIYKEATTTFVNPILAQSSN